MYTIHSSVSRLTTTIIRTEFHSTMNTDFPYKLQNVYQ